MLLITPAKAIEIQIQHIAAYGHSYPTGAAGLRAHLQHLTDLTPFPNLQEPQPITKINRYIPRGGQIESIIEDANLGFCRLLSRT